MLVVVSPGKRFINEKTKENKMKNWVGKKVIVRGDRSGVFCGIVSAKKGKEVEFRVVRKIHYWDGAAAVEQLAVDGVKNPNHCRFTAIVKDCAISDMIQILPCKDKAYKILMGVKEWRI